MATTVLTLDGRGRISVPAELRERLNLEPGDALFVRLEENGAVLRLAKAADSFAALGERQYREGRTKNLRAFAAEEGMALDDE